MLSDLQVPKLQNIHRSYDSKSKFHFIIPFGLQRKSFHWMLNFRSGITKSFYGQKVLSWNPLLFLWKKPFLSGMVFKPKFSRQNTWDWSLFGYGLPGKLFKFSVPKIPNLWNLVYYSIYLMEFMWIVKCSSQYLTYSQLSKCYYYYYYFLKDFEFIIYIPCTMHGTLSLCLIYFSKYSVLQEEYDHSHFTSNDTQAECW